MSEKTRIRSCVSKTRYACEVSARNAGWRRMTKCGVQLYFYSCWHCKGFHLTRRERPAYYAVNYYEARR